MQPDPGLVALRAGGALLAERPAKSGPAFSEATRCRVAYRDALVVAWHRTGAEPDRRRMAQANSVLSVVVGGHFPLGDVPWRELEKAHDLLAEMVGGELPSSRGQDTEIIRGH